MSSTYDADPSDKQRNIWRNEQTRLREKHVNKDDVDFNAETLEGLKYIAGVDLSFPLGDLENAVACLVVMSMPDLKIVHKKFLETKLYLPYISGYLAFREVEPLIKLINELKQDHPELYPQIILVDGNGLLHPRQFGIASHLGVLSNTPTIGIAKTFLVIQDELELSEIKPRFRVELLKKGDRLDLVGKRTGTVYGSGLRTADNALNPVFVSQGHRVSLDTALRVVLAACPKYRIPEPVRAADQESRVYIRTKSAVHSSPQDDSQKTKEENDSVQSALCQGLKYMHQE